MQRSILSSRFRKRLNLILLAVLVGGILALPGRLLHAEEEQSPTIRILTETALPAPDGSGKNRKAIGIGETVYLQLSGKFLGNLSKIKWTVVEGDQYLAKEECSSQGDIATLVIKQTYVPEGQVVTIFAVVEDKHMAEPISFTIVSPKSIFSENKKEPIGYLPNGHIGASNKLDLRVTPLSVCFNGICIK